MRSFVSGRTESMSAGTDEAGARTTAILALFVAAPISVPSDCPMTVCATHGAGVHGAKQANGVSEAPE